MRNILLIVLVLVFGSVFSRAQNTDEVIPGQNQEMFSAYIGTWKILSQSYDLGGSLTNTTNGVAEIKTVFENRYLDMDFKFKDNKSEFDMFWTLSYNCIDNKYFLFSRNSSYTFPYYGNGEYDAKAKSFAFLVNQYDTYGNRYKIVFKWEREDKFVIEMYNFSIKGAEILKNKFTLIKLD
jgi:hypothetical protein